MIEVAIMQDNYYRM